MTESNAKSKVKRAGDARKPVAKAGKPAAKARKTANAGTKPVKSDGDGTALAGEKSNGQASGKSASRLIDQRIRALEGWRGETLARMRALILEADPEVTEEWKWKGTPVWSHDGIQELIVCGSLWVRSYDLKDGAQRWSAHGMARVANASPVAAEGSLNRNEYAPVVLPEAATVSV